MDTGNQVARSTASSDPVPGSSVLDAIPCLVLVFERESGAVRHVNAALEELTGQGRVALLGTPWESLFALPDRERVRSAFSWGERPAPGVETSICTRLGETRRILWSVALMGQEQGTAEQVVLSGMDVTPESRTGNLFSQLARTTTSPALIGTDLAGRVNLYNEAAEQMLGHPASHMLGRVFDVALFDPVELAERAERLGVPADLRLFASDLSKLDRRGSNPDLGALDRRRRSTDGPAEWERRGGERRTDRRGTRGRRAEDGRGGVASLARDWTMIKNDGERITVSMTIVEVTDHHGETVGYVAVAHDVTEQRRSRTLLVAGLEREAQAVRRLQELDRAKDDFVATVSHELRTPITSIMGYVELMLEARPEDISPDQAEMLRVVQRNGDRLCALADDLLTLSSFESGEFDLQLAWVDLGAVVRRVEEALRPLIDGRRLEVRFEVPDRPVEIEGDPGYLERVLFNLMGNSLKFTEDGGVITCTLERDEAGATLEVSDTGIGIPAAEQEHLFTRFFRASTAHTRAIQGTGMGLTIVNAIVEAHGGEIAVRSEHGRGTSVRVFLPVKTEGTSGLAQMPSVTPVP